MSAEFKARENWKAALLMFGKGSREELDAYRNYISISNGQEKKQRTRRPQTVRKAAQIVTLSLF
ncbi:MAG: hypothetical protein LLG40_13870 [Deltaproteobacteria bacterium]|nr:hypothetical protein [Deltaproteobacteria bacterium]